MEDTEAADREAVRNPTPGTLQQGQGAMASPPSPSLGSVSTRASQNASQKSKSWPSFVYPLLGSLCGLLTLIAWYACSSSSNDARPSRKVAHTQRSHLVPSDELDAAGKTEDEEDANGNHTDEAEDDEDSDQGQMDSQDFFMGFKKGRLAN